jgi:hypothetical protein
MGSGKAGRESLSKALPGGGRWDPAGAWDDIGVEGWGGLPGQDSFGSVKTRRFRVDEGRDLVHPLMSQTKTQIKEVLPGSGEPSPIAHQRVQQRTKRGGPRHVRCSCISQDTYRIP